MKLSLLLCAALAVSAAIKPAKDRKPSIDFALKDSKGAIVKLSDYKGKVVLLNFWATYCVPCRQELPWFMDFEKKFASRKFAVLTVSMDDEWDLIKEYASVNKVTLRVLMGTEQVAQAYGGLDALPVTLLIDATGKVAATHVGLVPREQYEKEIAELTAK